MFSVTRNRRTVSVKTIFQCRRFGLDISFHLIPRGTIGSICTSAKLNSVNKHKQSELHKNASATCKAKSAPKESSCVANAINRLKKSSFDKLAIMLRSCHCTSVNLIVTFQILIGCAIWMRCKQDVRTANKGTNNNAAANSFTHQRYLDLCLSSYHQQRTEQCSSALREGGRTYLRR